MRKLLITVVSTLFLCPGIFAQDVKVVCPAAACTLAAGQPWVAANKIYIFRPLQASGSVYIFFRNNNPTSAHTAQTITVFQTPSTTVADLTNNADLWTQDQVTQNSVAGASCNNVNANNKTVIGASGLGTCYATTLFASQIAIRVTGSVSAAGTPDTHDLLIMQDRGEPKGQQAGASSTNVQGRVAAGGIPDNPVPIGATDGAGNIQQLTSAAADALGITGILGAAPVLFNSATGDRARGASATNLTTLTTGSGSTLVEKGARWQVQSMPAAGTQASAVRAAGAAGVRHVADCFSFAVAASTAPIAGGINVAIRDGASGAGTILQQWNLVVTATTGDLVPPFGFCGLNIVGSTATAMTIEFNAGAANLLQSVNLTGFDAQ